MEYLIVGLTTGLVVGIPLYILDRLWFRKITEEQRQQRRWTGAVIAGILGGSGGLLGLYLARHYLSYIAH